MNIFFVIDCFWHRSRTKTHYKLSETEQLLDQFSARLSLCPVSILKLLFTLYAEIYESLSRPVFGQDKISHHHDSSQEAMHSLRLVLMGKEHRKSSSLL